jgi:acyl-coenzyme A synthetase/AMP-(fatty) acid ligase
MEVKNTVPAQLNNLAYDFLSHARHSVDRTAVCVNGSPVNQGLVTGLAAFISPPQIELNEIQRQPGSVLPAVMIPKHIEVLERLPRNQNHKIDRNALRQQLEERKEAP